jgi:hypothetical protein
MKVDRTKNSQTHLKNGGVAHRCHMPAQSPPDSILKAVKRLQRCLISCRDSNKRMADAQWSDEVLRKERGAQRFAALDKARKHLDEILKEYDI